MVAEPFTASRQLTHCTLLDLMKPCRFRLRSKKLSTHHDSLSELGKSLLSSLYLPCGLGELFGPKQTESAMAQPVTAILSRQGELAAKARQFTNDTNEASLLVGRVFSRALSTFKGAETDEVITHAMRRDLDRLIEQLKKARH